jgi:biotin operon repressor
MNQQNTTPEFINYDEDTGRINFTAFRKYYKLAADTTRMICKSLGYEVIREGAEQYIVGDNQFNVSNSYYLKHAVFEYRKTMGLARTKSGDFAEYEYDAPEGVINYGVSHIEDEEVVKPISPSIRREPNRESKSILVPVDRGAELMRRRASVPTAPSNPAPGADALQVLVAALTEAQRASQAPDTLHPQKTLLEAEQQGFLITTEQLGQLLGMSKGTISSKKSGFRKLGFEFEKVKEGSASLWKVKRY